jgi:hypothetical protein
MQSWIRSIADALSARSPPSFALSVDISVVAAAAAALWWWRSLRRPRSLFFSLVFQ